MYFNEYISDRIVFNNFGGGLDEGSHTPVWIHIDVNLNDIVPISVDGVGDYNFIIIDGLIHNLIGFGLVEL